MIEERKLGERKICSLNLKIGEMKIGERKKEVESINKIKYIPISLPKLVYH